MSPGGWALLAGSGLVAAGLAGLLFLAPLLRRLLAFNVMGVGVYLLLLALAPRTAAGVADPVAQALVLTGIVISVAATALGLRLAQALRATSSRDDLGDDPDDRLAASVDGDSSGGLRGPAGEDRGHRD